MAADDYSCFEITVPDTQLATLRGLRDRLTGDAAQAADDTLTELEFLACTRDAES